MVMVRFAMAKATKKSLLAVDDVFVTCCMELV